MNGERLAAADSGRSELPPVVVARIDRAGRFSHDERGSGGAAPLDELQAAFQGGRWWQCRWGAAGFRAASPAFMRRHCPDGLVLIGPRVRVEVPPGFAEVFEPVELSGRMDHVSPQLRMLSGGSPTAEERRAWVLWLVLGVVGLGLLLPGAISYWAGAYRLGTLMIAVTGGVVLFVGGVILLARRLFRWFLVPSGLARLSAFGRAGQRVRVRTRCDSVAALRMVSTGKTTALVLEIWQDAGRVWRRPVTQREAQAFLAAWRSDEPPPTPGQIAELLGVNA